MKLNDQQILAFRLEALRLAGGNINVAEQIFEYIKNGTLPPVPTPTPSPAPAPV